MHGLTGTWLLVRTNLRIDRLKLPIVIVVLGAVFALTVFSVLDIYGGDNFEEQVRYAATSAPSIVGRIFAGPIHGPEVGSIVLNEGFLFTALAVAFMSTLTVIRHTRQNEETGRSELIGSMIVSKHAPLAAALLVAVFANGVFAILTTSVLLAGDLPLGGSIVTGLAMGLTGVTFASLAAVAAQLTDSSRGANALCALIIGVAFMLRAVGDILGNLFNNGLGVQSAFPSWLSPLGWGQQIYAYGGENMRLWPLLLFLLTSTAAVGAASFLLVRRDIGLGIFNTKPGKARAKLSLLSPFGLAKKLQKGILIGWTIAIFILGVTYGFAINEFQGFLEENEEFQEALSQFGENPNNAFLSIMIAFMGITITGYVTQALLKMRSEESNGRLESLLSTSTSRIRWMLSHVLFIFGGAVFLTLVSAASLGITYILATGTGWNEFWPILSANLIQLAAISAFASFVIVLFSYLPNLVAPLAWGAFAACILVLQLGVILNLPQWIINLSPFGHLPAMPADPFTASPIIGLALVSVTLLTMGLYRFYKRDILL